MRGLQRARFEEESRAFSDLATELSIAKWTRVVPMLAGLAVDGFGAAAALLGLWLCIAAAAAALAMAVRP